jgi:divergent polysaccharide deacetylase
MQSRRLGRSANAGWRRLGPVWRRLRSRHSPLGLLFLLALVVCGIFLAMLPALYQAKTPGGSTPRAFLAKAAAVAARAMSAVRPGTPSRKAGPAPRPVDEAALRPPPVLPAPTHTEPPRTEPAWLRFAAPTSPGDNKLMVAIAASAGMRLAAAGGVPHAGRDVFLDDDSAPAAIARQLVRLESVARGSAIAIGHAHDTTLAALRAWLPTLAGKGYALVPRSAVVRYRRARQDEAGG